VTSLELDGYLTWVIMTPQAVPIRPSAWIGCLWCDDNLIFADEAPINAALGGVALIRDIDSSLERLESRTHRRLPAAIRHGRSEAEPRLGANMEPAASGAR
jgi:hypothetical protein